MITNGFLRRRMTGAGLLLLACLLMLVVVSLVEIALYRSSELTGWTLTATVTLLLSYGLRKRLSMLPIGRVAIWLQLHIYTGLFAVFLFFLHIGWGLPAGWFEIALAFAFLGTIVSGLVGIVWSRTFPRIITRLGDEVLYDRIRGFYTDLQNQAEQCALEALRETGSGALSEFYQQTGYTLFTGPRFQWQRLYRDYQPTNKIERELNTLRRYMRDDELPFLDETLRLVQKKNLLDAHFTLQGALRYWLWVHVVFSVAVIPLILLHIVLVYGFTTI